MSLHPSRQGQTATPRPYPPSSGRSSRISNNSMNCRRQKRQKFAIEKSKQQKLQTSIKSHKESEYEVCLPSIFCSEVDECMSLLKQVDKKIKKQKDKSRQQFIMLANKAASIITFAFKFYLFKIRIFKRVRSRRIIQIQCWYRACLARHTIRRAKSARLLQSLVRGKQTRGMVAVYRRTRTRAAIKIQSWFRMIFAKKLARTMLPYPLNILRYHQERMAALKLQKALKCFVLRQKGRRFLILQKAARIKEKIEHDKSKKRNAQKADEMNHLLDSYNVISERKRSIVNVRNDIDNEKNNESHKSAIDVTDNKALSHHANLGSLLSQIGLILEKKSKQDVLDKKHGKPHQPLNITVKHFFDDYYGTTLGHKKCATFLKELMLFYSSHIRVRWFVIFLNVEEKDAWNMSDLSFTTLVKDPCLFPYMEKAVYVYLRGLIAMVESHDKIHESFKDEKVQTTLHKGKLAIRRAFNENEDITVAQIQEKLIASLEESLGAKLLEREYSAKVDIDDVLDMCLRQWYATKILSLDSENNVSVEKNNPGDEATTSLHFVYTKSTSQHCWKITKCKFCGMKHQQPIVDKTKASESSRKKKKNWSIPLVVEPWKYEEKWEDDGLASGCYRGINHSRIAFNANRKIAKLKIEKYLENTAIIPLEPVCLIGK